MEVIRNQEPKDNFLQKVRNLATKHNIVLIFDEITSGFRQKLGGIHLTYGVNPDMAVLGKAMGNGYAISAVIGKKEVMEYAQSSFISSTFWTDRIGPVAALKTIEIMKRDNVPKVITGYGCYINKSWEKLGRKHGFNLHIEGLPALTHFSFGSSNELIYKTLITQEMLKKGYLAATSVYACKDHKKEIVDRYIAALDSVFIKIKQIEEGANPNNYLENPVCHSGFKRIN
jgi:glutamate-1-semialdehyde 2,1-aminomutase